MGRSRAASAPVELPEVAGRPGRALAAVANLDVIQHALRRAHQVVLRVWDDPRELWRVAAVRGLLISAVPQRDGSTTFEIMGPLALFHQTAVYGRALGALVPPLAEQARFELAIRCDELGEKVLRVVPPLLLPRAPAPRRPPMALDARLARDLESDCTVEREPEPIASGDRLLFPQLAVDGWYIEIIGFATAEFLDEMLARYRAAGDREGHLLHRSGGGAGDRTGGVEADAAAISGARRRPTQPRGSGFASRRSPPIAVLGGR